MAVVCRTVRRRRGHYEVEFRKLGEPPYEKDSDQRMLERYIGELEQMIREAPSDWLWSHNRWKYGREEA